MTNRQSLRRDSTRFGLWLVQDAGRELRVARLITGKRQADVAAILGTSISHVSRVEHGLIRGISLPDLSRHAAAVGLRPSLRLYPTVSHPLDRAQIELLDTFRARIGTDWNVQFEVPMPIAGDLRATDAVISIPGCRCAVEAITRLADLQAQLRSARLKQRDLGADRLILVVRGTTANRRVLQAASRLVAESFPIGTKLALQHLAGSMDPGGDALILL